MKKVINFFTRVCDTYLPDAFVFSLLLTLIVFGVAGFATPHSASTLVGFWIKDFWSLNAFSMQMVFVLLGGHMLATTPAVDALLSRLSALVNSETQALMMLGTFSTLACWLNWGFGLIVSGILAVRLAQRLGKVNFGLFVATAYAGFLVWHGGLSGSIPLKIAGKDEILQGVFSDLSFPLEQTVFSVWNLIIVVTLFFLIPVLSLLLRTETKTTVAPRKESEVRTIDATTFAGKLENSRALTIIFSLLFATALISTGGALDINRLNLIFLTLAFGLHGTPRNFLRALEGSVAHASGIIIQFPFYAGIMGLMQYSGLADQISQVFVSISSAATLPLWTFLSAGIVNFFIPSGGGQWVVQGPIMLKAARDLAVDPAKISMALAWGDAWTNMIQPFWALPLLALANLKLKDIMGYCLIFTLASGVVISAVFFFY